MRRTKNTRAAAVRRAQQAKQERDGQRLARERAIEEALADFFENTGLAEQISEQAAAKAAKVIADGEQASREPRSLAAAAISRLEDLGETRGAIAELTGLTPAAVREVIATTGSNSARAGAHR